MQKRPELLDLPDRRLERQKVQNLFLKEIRERELADLNRTPEVGRACRVLQELTEKPLRRFLQFDLGIDDVSMTLNKTGWVSEISDFAALRARKDKVEIVRNLVREWASKWNIGADWIIDQSLETLAYWAFFPDRKEEAEVPPWNDSFVSWSRPVQDSPLPRTWPDWDPEVEERSKYVA